MRPRSFMAEQRLLGLISINGQSIEDEGLLYWWRTHGCRGEPLAAYDDFRAWYCATTQRIAEVMEYYRGQELLDITYVSARRAVLFDEMDEHP